MKRDDLGTPKDTGFSDWASRKLQRETDAVLAALGERQGRCQRCGKRTVQGRYGRPKKFCSDKCMNRVKWAKYGAKHCTRRKLRRALVKSRAPVKILAVSYWTQPPNENGEVYAVARKG